MAKQQKKVSQTNPVWSPSPGEKMAKFRVKAQIKLGQSKESARLYEVGETVELTKDQAKELAHAVEPVKPFEDEPEGDEGQEQDGQGAGSGGGN
jgi:hypothetical protein